MTHIRKLISWLHNALHTLYPFLVCWSGAFLFAAALNTPTRGIGGITVSIAGLAFCWAIDLAYARGKAAGTSDTAAKFAAVLTAGADTTITVDINHMAMRSGE